MSRDGSPSPTALTPQTSLESVSSYNTSNNETVKSPWSRLRQRVHELAGRSKNERSDRRHRKYGSLLKLANEERRNVHQTRRYNSQVRLNTNDDGTTALWHVIHLLEERVEVLENTLDVSREHISKTEEKCENLQRQVEKILEKRLQKPPLDADTDRDSVRDKMSLCFEQIRNKDYRLNHVEPATLERTSRRSRKCAGCGKGTF
ncbi:uncharacterized protein LOC116926171 isoform X1 [Daphnia magna]|uniref:uncharacterized protein LOC116926171 isoform X1 n=1 Tax=Daphnia magna TaxID=35525 RepID=UPI001E1BC0DE|nr:uncharacterized protein LOC116926171 isoform X1 [Daphnia magna]